MCGCLCLVRDYVLVVALVCVMVCVWVRVWVRVMARVWAYICVNLCDACERVRPCVCLWGRGCVCGASVCV